MDDDWSRIYLYVAGKSHSWWRKNRMPDDILVDSLSDEQIVDLNRLKEWLYRQRTKARQEAHRSERRLKKEEEVARRTAEQPALFDF